MEVSEQRDDAKNECQLLDPAVQAINKKLMRLSVDERVSTKRKSILFDDSAPVPSKTEIIFKEPEDENTIGKIKIKKLVNSESRFPRIEEMSHFHYNSIEFPGKLEISMAEDQPNEGSLDTAGGCLIKVICAEKNWIVKRTYQDLVGLDRQLHRCIYDRSYSKLDLINEAEKPESRLSDEEMKEKFSEYLERLNDIAGNNLNCGPILNWFELDNHGNHLVVMEADDSAINVPAIAAAHVVKRYIAQAPDEISLEVGEFVSVIDMPPSEETIWWRGKKGFEVGFFPSSCVDVLIDKDLDSQLIPHGIKQRPISKRRGKFITFLRYFFRSRPSKDELMQTGILRERTFGCDLGEHLERTGRDVPLVLEVCSSIIEEFGIVDGIYRLSGITSNMQRLRLAFDNEDPPALTESRYLHDIHCISSLLKTYFRELPNPLLTYELYDKFLAAMRKTDDTERTVAFHHAIQRLPPPHYRSLEYLLRHLEKCAASSGVTSMNEKNLAIVWAPNLLRPNVKEPCGTALLDIRNQALIVEYLLKNVGIFFDKNLASAAIAFYPEEEDVPSTARNGQEEEFVLDKNSLERVGSSPPKLISLTEARARMKENNKIAEPSTKPDPTEKIRRKSRPPSNPTIPASIPISPGPSLLSLEEAQARSKARTSKLLLRRGSVDVLQEPSRTNKENFVEITPKKRSWKGLFSRNKSVSDELDSFGEGRRLHTLTTFKRRISYDMAETASLSSPRSQSSYNLRELSSSDVQERPSQGKKGRKKKMEISAPLGVRTSSFVSYVGGMSQLERTHTAPSIDLRESARLAKQKSLEVSKTTHVNSPANEKSFGCTEVRGADIAFDSKIFTIADVRNGEMTSEAGKEKCNTVDYNNDAKASSSSHVENKDIRNSAWIQKYDDIARTCLESMNMSDNENVAIEKTDTSQTTETNKQQIALSPRHREPQEIRVSLLSRGNRELQSHGNLASPTLYEDNDKRSLSADPVKYDTDVNKRVSTMSEGGVANVDVSNGNILDWVPVMQRSLSLGINQITAPETLSLMKEKKDRPDGEISDKGAIARRDWTSRPFSSYDNHPALQTEDSNKVPKDNTKHRPSIYDNLL